jgi:hypothetical protein
MRIDPHVLMEARNRLVAAGTVQRQVHDNTPWYSLAAADPAVVAARLADLLPFAPAISAPRPTRRTGARNRYLPRALLDGAPTWEISKKTGKRGEWSIIAKGTAGSFETAKGAALFEAEAASWGPKSQAIRLRI